MSQPIPSLFDPPPTINRRDTSYHSLQPDQCKTQSQRICYILSKHPLLRYDEIPSFYSEIFGDRIKESSVVARLNELVSSGNVSNKKEKLNCNGKLMVTAYEVTNQ